MEIRIFYYLTALPLMARFFMNALKSFADGYQLANN